MDHMTGVSGTNPLPRRQPVVKGRMNQGRKCFSHQPTLVNTGGPDASLLYKEDTGLCTCGTAENKHVARRNLSGKCVKLECVLPLVYPLQGLRQSLDQSGAVGKGLRGFR